jgi:hypothetical protein
MYTVARGNICFIRWLRSAVDSLLVEFEKCALRKFKNGANGRRAVSGPRAGPGRKTHTFQIYVPQAEEISELRAVFDRD